MSSKLINAVKLCNSDLVKKLLLNDDTKIYTIKKDALIEASTRGYEEIVDILLKDPRSDPNNKGCFALMCALRHSYWNIVSLILECDRIDLTFSGIFMLDILKNELAGDKKKNFWKKSFEKIIEDKKPFIDVKLTCEADIINTKNMCKSYIKKHGLPKEDRGYVKFVVDYVYDVNLFIKYGFIPDFKTDNHILEDYLLYENVENRYDILDFWHSISHNIITYEHFNNLNTCRYWKYCSLKYNKRKAIEKCDSFKLLTRPELLYSKSKRPITNMKLFDHGLTYDSKDIISENNTSENNTSENNYIGTINISGILWNFIRVTRYAKGMSRGLYYGNSSINFYGGVFYYLEKESKVLLLFKTYKIYKNKYCAVLDLCPSSINGSFRNIPYFEDYFSGKSNLPDDLMMTAKEVWDYAKNGDSTIKAGLMNEDKIKHIPQEKRYAGKTLGFYAIEDVFDQDLYQSASKKNIDILIFENMIGSRQIVKEILHVKKEKIESFLHLAYPNE